MTTLYLWSKMLHRIVMFVVIFLTLVMAGTGTTMKYPAIGSAINVDPGMLRYIHNQLSTYFSIALFLMIITGVSMYIFPLLRKKTTPSTPSTPTTPPAQL